MLLSENCRAILRSAVGSAADGVLDIVERSGSKDVFEALSDIHADGIPSDTIERVKLASSVARLTDDDVHVASGILREPNIRTLRDVALNYSTERIARMVLEESAEIEEPTLMPEAELARKMVGSDPHHVAATSLKKAQQFQRRLFQAEPTAVLQRMVASDEISIHASPAVRKGVAKFLDKQPSFNIRDTSILSVLRESGIVNEVVEDVEDRQVRSQIVSSLKTLQTVQALTPVPEAVAPLLERGMTSVTRVSSMPEKTFVATLGPQLATVIAGEDASGAEDLARSIHQHAVISRQQIDDALLQIYQTIKGTGLAAIDGVDNIDTRMQKYRRAVAAAGGASQINLEELFGGMDFCECESCGDVLSPTAYFVELLQYLQNNNLDPDKKWENTGIQGTALEQLLIRRPDLQHLELTCENANTILPYIDLANEVMESFVAHLNDYRVDWTPKKQVALEVFNIEGEASSELLSAPQHTNYKAYCILKNAKYPIASLPYFQPLDAIRIYLRYLETSRYELVDRFRKPEPHAELTITPQQATELSEIHTQIVDRAAVSEYLGLSLDEYIIITKEMFWPKRYFELTQGGSSIDVRQYQQQIGIRPAYEHWGYSRSSDMLSMDEFPEKKGLDWVKAQFLRRSGLTYMETVDLVKTRFMNPMYPSGRAKVILESIRFSYRFLQTLVDDGHSDKRLRFKLLIDFLSFAQPWVEMLKSRRAQSRTSRKVEEASCASGLSRREIAMWVYKWFECLGKLIVLESGEGPELPIEGWLYFELSLPEGPLLRRAASETQGDYRIGYLHRDGEIKTEKNGGELVANVAVNGQVFTPNRELLVKKHPGGRIELRSEGSDNDRIVWINHEGYLTWEGRNADGTQPLVKWLPAVDTCNIEKVRLQYLNGDPIGIDDWDRMQRFIRLYRKIGWTINEIDQALLGLADVPELSTETDTPGAGAGDDTPDESDEESKYLEFADFRDQGCSCDKSGNCSYCEGDGNNGDAGQDCEPYPYSPENRLEIGPGFLKQLMYLKKLQELTGIELAKMLALWGDIGTQGVNPLYSRLFLTHNLLGVDPVFQGDENDNYFTTRTEINNHIPVILAALQLKPDDLTAILRGTGLDRNNTLSMGSISMIYRHSLLARSLGVKVPLFMDAIRLFGDPFASAQDSLEFVTLWNRMSEAGFTASQLLYCLFDKDNPLRPLGPQKAKVLRTVKGILDGLNNIDAAHPDLMAAQESTVSVDQVLTKAALLYSQAITADIAGLTEGSKVYMVRTPVGLSVVIPPNLASKISSSDRTLSIKGNLTEEEKTEAKSLSNNPSWAAAIDSAAKQSVLFIKNNLGEVFEDKINEAVAALTAGDVAPKPAATETDIADPGTAPEKRVFFLRAFLPFLRSQLADRLIFQTMAGVAGISSSGIVEALLRNTFKVGPEGSQQSALDALKQIQKRSTTGTGTENSWTGFLVPQSSDTYSFVGYGDTQPAPLIFDGEEVAFTIKQEDPFNIFSWSSDPLLLTGGRLYPLKVQGQTVPGDFMWKTARDGIAAVPGSCLLPDYSVTSTMDVFVKLQKAAIIINGFGFDSTEVAYLQSHGKEAFSGFDLNLITLKAWRRALAYKELRDSLPRLEYTLIDLFKWAGRTDSKVADIPKQVAATTSWDASQVKDLIGPNAFGMEKLELFRNEIALIQLKRAIDVVKKLQLTNASIPFQWADLKAHFNPTRKIAEDILKNIRSRFTLDDYEKVVKPLHDELRKNQRDALIAYLVAQPELIKWGVIDADSLFEFFLIDVKMGACMQTSRIKQAISTVQTFVQRCILGLEEKKEYGVKNDALDAKRWEWMSKQTVWTANRKVFLYPENWIVSSLRDDKTPFYKELEGDLLQKDISPENNQAAFKSYLSKLDQVASLRTVGVYSDDYVDDQQAKSRLHCIARTQCAPYFFYYRTYQSPSGQWTPWEPVKIDIPVYEAVAIGSYVVPVVWSKRVLIFIGHLAKKTSPNSGAEDTAFSGFNEKKPNQIMPREYWEIKLAWSELRNGKWTQKMISADALVTVATDPPSLPRIDGFLFIPQVITVSGKSSVTIEVWQDPSTYLGNFKFRGTGLSRVTGDTQPELPSAWTSSTLSFHYADDHLSSLQRGVDGTLSHFGVSPKFSYPSNGETKVLLVGEEDFYHRNSHQLLDAASASNELKPILDVLRNINYNNTAEWTAAFGWTGLEAGVDSVMYDKYHELKKPYSLYNWEVGFHAPMQLADALLSSQQFDQALQMVHNVFDPYADGDNDRRVWQWKPFTYTSAEYVLEALFNSLKGNRPETTGTSSSGREIGPIEEWRDNPFQPHVVARNRPVAYMKWVVMKYIQILIAYGDHYFRRNTLEDLPSAIQCYILASHIYGPKGQRIPKRGKKKTETYYLLLDKWDAFGNAVVEMELAFPFSNQTPQPIGLIDSGDSSTAKRMGGLLSKDIVLANLFGFATARYFCIPDNPQLRALRDTIDDRLYKIRNCMDIDGRVRSLALWEPELDVGQLVRAVADGLSLSSVLNDLYTNLPNYRFLHLHAKALELCAELRGLCNQFLSIKEKGDGEALQLMRSSHEMTINNLAMELKKKQLEEAQKAMDTIRASRKAPAFRYQFFASLAGAEAAAITDDESEYQEIALQIEKPTSDGDLRLTANEKLEMDEARKAQESNEDSGHLETLAGILHALPSFNIHGEPFGCGVEVAWGMPNLASAASAGARYIQVNSSTYSFSSSNAGRKAGNIRQYQDRLHQMNVAGHEIKQINSQIAGAQIRIDLAEMEIASQQKVIDNAAEVDQFLRNKYTSNELYSYLETTTRQLLYQTYLLAYDIAKEAELAFQFERNAREKSFIRSGYWDAARDGLQSGENLWLALKQMEAAYQADRGYDFEIQKVISVRQLNPLALLELREKGVCQVDVPEVLFDMDFPGHYYRRIKSVTLTIPCVVGPWTNVNATLKLLQHRYRVDPTATNSKDYVEAVDGGPDVRFKTARVPVDAIAVSSAQNDSGIFELHLKDERYLPFEGAGVISSWQIQLPNGFRQFDYDTITDVVLSMRYTSCDGGDKLRKLAAGSVTDFIKSVEDLSASQGLFAFFDLKSEFATEWARFSTVSGNAGSATRQKLVLKDLPDRLPMFTKGRDPAKIIAKDVTVLTPMALARSDLALEAPYTPLPPTGSGAENDPSSNDTAFDSGPVSIGKLNAYKISSLEQPLGPAWALKVKMQPGAKREKIWLLVRYVLPEMK